MDPLVSICCCTYNHEDYISDCIEGFLIQETNFDIEILIHDDASKDGTAEIIKKYEKQDERIKVIYQSENQYSKGIRPISQFNFDRAKGQYITICEGDDYWTDPKKLQKQIDIFRKDSSIGCVVTDYSKKNQTKNTYEHAVISAKFKNIKEGYIKPIKIFSESLRKTRTATSMIEKKWIDKIINEDYLKHVPGDTQIFGYLFLHSKIYFINADTSVYRILPESESHTKSFNKKQLFLKSYIDYMRHLNKKYPLGIKDRRYLKKSIKILRIRQLAHEQKKVNILIESILFILNGYQSMHIIKQIKYAFRN